MLACAIGATEAGIAANLQCDSVAQPAAIHVVTATGTTLTVVASARSWLELDEDGKALTVEGADSSLTIPSPPRLARRGIWLEPGSKTLKIANAANGQAQVRFGARLYCKTADARYLALSSLDAAATTIAQGRVSAAELAAAVTALENVEANAGAADIRAYAAHLSAQLRLIAGQSAKASTAFMHAEALWNLAGDGARALAARVAHTEEAYALGDFDSTLRAVENVSPAASGATGYYYARLVNCRCVALKYKGLREQATDCFASLENRLNALREPLELANALLNLGGLQRDLGRIAAAQASVARAERLTAEQSQGLRPADIAIVRGRLRLLRADLALRQGSVGLAIGDYHAALADFEIANARRWRASTLIQMAAIFGRIGAFADAFSVWKEGFELFSPGEAPARVASSLLTLAQIQRDDANPLLAAWLAEMAARRFADLGTPAEREIAAIVRIRSLLDAGDVQTAKSAIASFSGDRLRNAGALELANAAVALAEHRAEDALRSLAAVGSVNSLDEEVEKKILSASAIYARGDTSAAMAELDDTQELIERAEAASSSALLRTLLQRKGERLRRLAIDWAIASPRAEANLDLILRWQVHAVLPRTGADEKVSSAAAGSGAFDLALAQELLLAQRSDSENPSSILASLLGRRAAPAAESDVYRTTLASLQAQLDHGTALFAIVEGNERAAALWIGRDSARLTRIASPQTLRRDAESLSEALSSPATPMALVAEKSSRMAEALWPGDSAPAGLGHMLVLAGPIANSIAWPALTDAQGRFLVETTDLSIVHVTAFAADGGQQPPDSIDVAIAPQRTTTDPTLSSLQSAQVEPALIRAAAEGKSIALLDASDRAIKDDLLQALKRRGSWVHVAAHGTTRRGFIGRSGIWLDAANDSTLPQFLSVLDLYQHGVNADLVVLNACELAAGEVQAPGSLAFADGLVQLGARNVVAAIRPVSDSATTLWIPVFYRHLLARPEQPAAALRQAQLALFDSRSYRHAFYWSSFSHLAALPGVARTTRQPSGAIAP